MSVILQKEDRNQSFWESAFEGFSFFGDLERAGVCLEEVKKHERAYDFCKLFQSAEVGEALECIIP